MGSPVSPVVANIFMEFVEEVAVSTSPSPVRFWKRYVDDTFCFLQKTAVDEVLQHLNTISSTIKFTVEQEKDGQLPFLDVLVFRKEDGSIDLFHVMSRAFHMHTNWLYWCTAATY